MRRVGSVLLVGLVVVGGVACGDDEDGRDTIGPTTSSSAATSTSAPASGGGETVSTVCPIAEADVAEVVGVEVRDRGAERIEGGSTSCFWIFEDGSVTVNLEVGGGRAAHEQYDEIWRREDVEGLGDEARWAPGQRVLTALQGDDVVMVLVEAGIDEDALRVATGIAELALATF